MNKLIAASVFAIVGCAGLAHADDDDLRCRLTATETRLSLADIEKKVTADGIQPRKIELDDGCWEVKGIKDGLRVEAKYHPATGELLQRWSDD
ncbi:PepSY domain-containing protein [Rhizobium sp. G187]|uniref:PepSY domain-containing protein n=1 Tax=Rhizobium sp. G187 TaxID=3451352 RepID=UPI003EE598CD